MRIIAGKSLKVSHNWGKQHYYVEDCLNPTSGHCEHQKEVEDSLAKTPAEGDAWEKEGV